MIKLLKGFLKKPKVNENPSKLTYKDTSIYRYRGKKILYTGLAKELLKENSGLLKAVNFLSKNKSERRFVDPKNRFEILKVTNQIISQKRSFSPSFTKNAFVLTINKKKPLRFFIKETRGHVDFSLTEEMLALKIIEKKAKANGFKIIKPHFSFDNYPKRKGFFYDHTLMKSFIVYQLSYLSTVSDAISKKKLTSLQKKEIASRFSKLNESLKNLGFKNLDLKQDNCFVDFSKKPVTYICLILWPMVSCTLLL